MTKGIIEGVQVRGMHSCVPAQSRSLENEELSFGPGERERLQKSIGVLRRRVAPAGVMTSDLCFTAAMQLLADLDWDPKSIDVLVFVTQTSDYVIPSTACSLQSRLGLTDCMAFDINLGCSGYPYGLWTCASLLKSLALPNRKARALLLAGDVSTARLQKNDKSTIPLFGDAGSATALELDDGASMHGIFGTNGDGVPHILIEAGGIKMPLLPPSDGFSQESSALLYEKSRLHLNGLEVFNFTLQNVPGLIKDLLLHAKSSVTETDYFVMHQANAMMLNHLAKKSGITLEKLPLAMQEYGNTSSASIPLAIADQLHDQFDQAKKLALVGFGVGWSWGAVHLTVGPMPTPKVIEYGVK